VLQRYAKSMRQASAAEIAQLRERGFLKDTKAAKSLKKWLHHDPSGVPAEHRATLDQALASSALLKTTVSMRQELSHLWQRSTLNTEQLVHQLQDWCERAEKSGVGSLAEFSRRLRCYA